MAKETEQLLGEMYADIKWIKDTLDKKANKWVEKLMVIMVLGCLGWMGTQWLKLIETANAMINNLN